jgi:hypothetical protein
MRTGRRGPLAVDLFCGLGGWTEGLLAEGYRVVGFDNERHHYGEAKYPGQLVIQDVLTLHGSQFKDAALIVASPPCQAYSYRAMPWKKAKALPPPSNELFDACFRIQREAIAAAGHHIPLVVENVCGAQKWVGRARWHYGSFYLWGDVPALMPIVTKRLAKVGGITWTGPRGYGSPGYVAKAFNFTAEQRLRDEGIKAGDRNKARASGGHKWTTGFDKHTKNDGGSWFNVAHNTTSGHGQNPDGRLVHRDDGLKVPGNKLSENGFAIPIARQIDKSKKPVAFSLNEEDRRQHLSYSRKAASAHIAKIPRPLAQWIARAWKPLEATA